MPHWGFAEISRYSARYRHLGSPGSAGPSRFVPNVKALNPDCSLPKVKFCIQRHPIRKAVATPAPASSCLLGPSLFVMDPNPDPVAELLDNYHELNSSDIQELDTEPSPLEFMRFVARNTPFVVRKGAASWSATKTWTSDYLANFLRDQTVNVAVTPNGCVDACRFCFVPRGGKNSINFPLLPFCSLGS